MTRMEKIALLLAFWVSPDDYQRQIAEWEDFTGGDKDFSEDALFSIIAAIATGIDEKLVKWSALDAFKQVQLDRNSIDVDGQ